MMTNEELRAHYARIAGEPSLWHSQATYLLRAADAAYREFGHHFADLAAVNDAPDEDVFLFLPYLFLGGLAIENMLKGVLIQRNPQLVRDGRLHTKEMGGGVDGHDLLGLATKVSPELARQHHELLGRLTVFVRWGGRYPVPKHAGHRRGWQYFSTDDPLAIRALLDVLTDILMQEQPQPEPWK